MSSDFLACIEGGKKRIAVETTDAEKESDVIERVWGRCDRYEGSHGADARQETGVHREHDQFIDHRIRPLESRPGTVEHPTKAGSDEDITSGCKRVDGDREWLQLYQLSVSCEAQ